MGIDGNFEADARLTDESLALALEAAGAILVGRDASGIENEEWSGYFVESGLSFNVCGGRGSPQIKAKDPKGANFMVARRCVFRYGVSDYDLNVRDLERLLAVVAERLVRISSCRSN